MNIRQSTLYFKIACISWLKNKAFWLILILLPFLLYVSSMVSIPDAANMTVLISAPQTEYAERVMSTLMNENNDLQFVRAENREYVREEVMSGRADCGFVLTDDFDEKTMNMDNNQTITYISSSSTTKGLIAQETVYASYFKVYNDVLIADLIKNGKVFAETGPQVTSDVLTLNNRILANGSTFAINFEYAETGGVTQAVEKNTINLLALVCVIIFLAALSSAGTLIASKNEGVYNKVSGAQKSIFEIIDISAPVLVTAIYGCVVLALFGLYVGQDAAAAAGTAGASAIGRIPGGVFISSIHLLLVAVLSIIWCWVYRRLFKNPLFYYSTVPVLMVAALLLSPLYGNSETYLGGFLYLKYLLPIGYSDILMF